jgi:phage baseplate assembly protein W
MPLRIYNHLERRGGFLSPEAKDDIKNSIENITKTPLITLTAIAF